MHGAFGDARETSAIRASFNPAKKRSFASSTRSGEGGGEIGEGGVELKQDRLFFGCEDLEVVERNAAGVFAAADAQPAAGAVDEDVPHGLGGGSGVAGADGVKEVGDVVNEAKLSAGRRCMQQEIGNHAEDRCCLNARVDEAAEREEVGLHEDEGEEHDQCDGGAEGGDGGDGAE